MPLTQDELYRKEEKLKELVYSKFDQMQSEAVASVNGAKSSLDGGGYDDKEAFMIHGSLNQANQRWREVHSLIGKLHESPYFAHVEASFDTEDGDLDNFYLSDCESLEDTITTEDGGMLLPFKQNPDRPISSALFHCYQAKKGEPITYHAPRGDITFYPKLICNTEIESRKLLNVTALFPQMDVSQFTADELLEFKLQQNRNNPTLRNIISTLQQMQFEIIEKNTEKSFVVQGCAGSGKSQCMLHRLFFLRDVLAKNGWNKVLLLTPTKLFRQYSADLIRRYQLSDIYNCSIADLYRNLLNAYDERFKDRQYVFQLTEEYLPDGYLHEVYNEDNVQNVEVEIEKAIKKYVRAGCTALGIDVPKKISSVSIKEIIDLLDAQMEQHDAREKKHEEDEEYQKKRSYYEKLLKDQEASKRKEKHYLDEQKKNAEASVNLQRLIDELQTAEKERADWVEQREKNIATAKKELEIMSKKVEQGTDLQAPAKYARQLYRAKNLTEGVQYVQDEEFLDFLNNDYIAKAQADLDEVIKDKKASSVLSKYDSRRREIEANLKEISDDLSLLQMEIEDTESWLRSVSTESNEKKSKNTLVRSEMERSRYFLARIESAVFEQEVWNVLSPIKEKYEIQTIQIEEIKGGKKKETRILYKADLLFYVMIYMKLHSNASLPTYNLICIDEGQDLHRADYDVLHEIYPDVTLNIFGDVDQVLHADCGISDWKSQTGIQEVYPLMTNYRNTAAIVDFCNKKFGINMKYIGSVEKDSEPIEVTDTEKIPDILGDDTVLVVKDKEKLGELCDVASIDISRIEYLDTLSEKASDKKIECYSIYAAKGLEFKNVFVYASGMSKNQKVVACTRAMGALKYYEG